MKQKLALLLAALLITSAAAYGCAKKDIPDPNPDTNITSPSEDGKNDQNQENGKDQADGKTDEAEKDDKPATDAGNKDDTKPEVKPETKPNKPSDTEQPEMPEVPAPDAGLPETKPEAKPETKPEAKPETKPETKPDNAGSNDASVDLSGKTAAEIISMIYEKKPVDLRLATDTLDLSDADAVEVNAGLSSTDGIKEIAVSEPMMGSQAYSMVLVRVSDSANAASVAQTMKDNINPRKWICVEADDIKAASKGDLALFFMVDSAFADTVTASEIMEAFKSVCGGSLDSEI